MNILKRLNISYLEIRAYFRFAKKVKTSIRFYNNINTSEIPDVSALSIKRTLKTLGVNFTDGFTCLITSCPVCKKTVNAEKPKIFINKTTGYFLCNGCKLSGQWDLLEKCLSLKKDSKSAKEITSLTEKLIPKEESDQLWIKIQETTDPLIDVSDSDFPELLTAFNFANIQKMFMCNLEARIDKSRKNMYFPLYGIDGKIHGYKVINSETNEEKTVPSQGCGGLIISKPFRATAKDSTATLVASVIDFLILSQSKLSCSAVCLPYGINSLPQSLLPSLERFNKLVLWFGNESCSWDSVKHFSKKLGEKRCLFVRPIDKQLLPRLVRDDKEMKHIISSAQPVWHKSITTFASLRQDVFCDLQNIEKVQGVKWKRYPTLNKILKGHRRGELTILTGPTGCGKTTFMSEYSLDLAMQGVNTLWGSFEIRNARLARTMLQQFAGIPLELNLNQFDHWADEFERLPIYFMTFHGQQSVKVVMEAVEHAQYIHDISHVIIDNVQFMMGMTEEPKHMDRFWKQDVIIAAFRTFATRKNCHVTLVIHPRKERDTEDLTTSSIFGGAKASQEADNVLLIQDKRLTSVRGKKYLQVAKNRYSGDLGIMALDFEKSGLSYEQKKRKTVDEKDESLECK